MMNLEKIKYEECQPSSYEFPVFDFFGKISQPCVISILYHYYWDQFTPINIY